MSVLLTASKVKACAKPRSARPKKKKATFNKTPPRSNEKTSVWYWILDGAPTTVMFTRESNEVWCNGAVLDTIEGFAEDDENGGKLDFLINQHKARIVRQIVQGKYRREMVYILFVDGCMITEHSGQPPEEATTNISQSEAMGAASALGPPSYSELFGNGSAL